MQAQGWPSRLTANHKSPTDLLLRLAAPKSHLQHQEKGYALTNLPDPGKVVPDKRGCGLWATKRVVGDKPSSVHEPMEDFFMSAYQDASGITRRQLLVGALAGGTGMVIPGPFGLFDGQRRQRLFVNTARGRLLSLGAPVGHDRPRPWTWRMVLTDSLTGDPDADLNGEAVESIRRYAADRVAAERGADAVSSQAVTDLLEGLHPSSGCMSLSRQWEEYLTRASAAARAHLLLEDILNRCDGLQPLDDGRVLQLDMQLSSAGRAAWLVKADDIALLRETVARLQLPIDIVVT